MPERDQGAYDSQSLPEDLFANLPEPVHQAPSATSTSPAAGSRRARREAAQKAPEHRGPEATSPSPVAAAVQPDSADQTVSADKAPAAQTVSADKANGSSLDDLFEAEHDGSSGRGHGGRKKRRTGCLVALIVVLALIGGIVGVGAWVMNTYRDQINDVMGWGEPADWEPGLATGEALVTIRAGDTGSPVSTALYEAGVTKTESVFYDYLVDENLAVTFYPGVYTLQKKMTASAALEALEDPANKRENTVSIREGGTIESSLPLITESIGIPLEDLQGAVADPSAYGVDADDLEGWLFPAVYTFDPEATAAQVIQRMVDRTRESLDAAGVPAADQQRILTVASIIEREGRTDDFAKVSRVIQNRLDDGMKLQMDSTAQYGYGELHAGVVSTSDEAQFDDNPWNTYVREGLPAGPIASPSDAAIAAAMHPADGPWLYFVTINPQTGETVFSTTYEEHQAAIKIWGEWCEANPDQGC